MHSNSSQTGSDVSGVIVTHDDVSNYNPEQILPLDPDKIKQVRNWLAPTAYDTDSSEFHKHITAAAEGTGAWLPATPGYQTWLADPATGMLWIIGVPGSGKSVFAARLAADLSHQNGYSTPALHFFFRQTIDANRTPNALLRDWLAQILPRCPSLQHHLWDDYVKGGKKLASLARDDLWRELREALQNVHGRVYCVADALDEMDAGNDDFLLELAQLGSWKPDKVKLLITSRPVARVEGPLRMAHATKIRLHAVNVDVDIDTFVRHGLEGSGISADHQALIREAIPGRANGLFLYAKLAMDSFLEPHADIPKVLQELPSDMNAMYTDLLREHARRSGIPHDVQLLVLQWVTHAARPLRLIEMAEMLMVAYRHGLENKTMKETKETVRMACGPLLEILPNETISVVHHSLTEFLIGATKHGEGSGEYPVFDFGPTHERLALLCLSYLSSGCLSSVAHCRSDEIEHGWLLGPDTAPLTQRARIQSIRPEYLQYPFLDYAATNWHLHARRSATATHDQVLLLKAIDSFFADEDIRDLCLYLERLGPLNYSLPRTTSLHLAARLGICQYVKMLCETRQPGVNSLDGSGATALWLAANNGYGEVVRILIAAGADPDAEDATYGLRPLHRAATFGYEGVARALLEAGVSPMTAKTKENPDLRCGNARRTCGDAAFKYACQSGHVSVVQACTGHIDDIAIIYRAIGWAMISSHTKVVQKLLEYPGVDINNTVFGGTPLFLACKSGNLDMVLALLSAGADPRVLGVDFGTGYRTFAGIFLGMPEKAEMDSTRGDTALHQLCACKAVDDERYPSVVATLIEHGADVHQRRPDGTTPLHCAFRSPVATRLLLDAGADANAVDNSGRTPLFSQRQRHGESLSPEIISLLIENGHADINKTMSDGYTTPLLYTLKSRDSTSAMKLLEYSPNCNVIDEKTGDGPLHMAMERGSAELLRALLAAGADPSLRNRRGQTAMHLIEPSHSADLVAILADAGADINARDAQGVSPLMQYVRKLPSYRVDCKTMPEIMTQLLAHGADTNTRDNAGNTLLHIDMGLKDDKQREDIASHLLGMGLPVRATNNSGHNLLHEMALHDRAAPDTIPLWEKFIGLGVDIGGLSTAGRTPLHLLAMTDHTGRYTTENTLETALDFVLARTADVDQEDNNGFTALHLAAMHSETTVSRLLEAGACLSKPTLSGWTPLHLACMARRSNIVGLILGTLAAAEHDLPLFPYQGDHVQHHVNAKDRKGLTPLFYACRSGSAESVWLLLEAGADISAEFSNMALRGCAEFGAHEELRIVIAEASNRGPPGIEICNEEDERCPRHYIPHTYFDICKLDDILQMLVARGVDVSDVAGVFKSAVSSRDEYILSRLHRVENPTPDQAGAESPMFSCSLGLFVEERCPACTSVADQTGPMPGGSDLRSLLRTGECSSVRSLFDQKLVDFCWEAYEMVEDKAMSELAMKSMTTLFRRYCAAMSPEELAACATDDQASLGSSLLHYAIRAELPNMPIVRMLVEEFGVSAAERGKMGEHSPVTTALHTAAGGDKWWHMALALPYLVVKGAQLDALDEEGNTPLHVALSKRHGSYKNQSARWLVERGANLHALDEEGRSCLALAVAGRETRPNTPSLARTLIAAGAPLAPDALFTAIDNMDLAAVEELLQLGADVNVPLFREANDIWCPSVDPKYLGHDQAYPIMRAACLKLDSPTAQERSTMEALVKMLLRHGAEIYGVCKLRNRNMTCVLSSDVALHTIFICGGLYSPFLALPSFDPNHTDGAGCTVFHAACRGDNDIAADVAEHYDADHSAVVVPPSPQSLFCRLVELGADLRVRDHAGQSAIHHLTGRRRCRLERWPLPLASLAEVLERCPDLVNEQDNSGRTPLLLLLARERPAEEIAEAVDMLLAAGADATMQDHAGTNALHILASRLPGSGDSYKIFAGAEALFTKLVAAGADINARNSRGRTPAYAYFDGKNKLNGPLAYDKERIAEFLAKATTILTDGGVDFTVRDHSGQGLLHVAASGQVERFRWLVEEAGLDARAEDNDGKTVLDLAVSCGNTKVLALFDATQDQ